MLLLATTSAQVQAQITIAGDVYGGGKNGAVGTDFTTNTEADKDLVTLESKAFDTDGSVKTTATIAVHSGTIRTVFGGGENGRTYGSTNVTVDDASVQIGLEELKGTALGGLFGAGDGASAYVFGNTTVTLNDGRILQNVYGGGNQADLMGHTKVHILGGDVHAPGVFGGARLANIYGYSYVFVDGQNLKNDLIVNCIYGGNDISGTIASSTKWAWTNPESKNMVFPFDNQINTDVDKTWNAFVRTTNPDKADGTGKKIFIGQVFGGGNGDYDTYADYDTKVTIPLKEWNSSAGEYQEVEGGKTFTDLTGRPTLVKTYLEIGGGTIAYLYGGGNAATVTEKTIICIDNSSEVVTSIDDASGTDILQAPYTRLQEMGLNTTQLHAGSAQFQFSRVFGGNNKAAMAIRPVWDLKKAQIRDLYSGGNAGNMTYSNGILLELKSDNLTVDNVYGGCRMADVNPDRHQIAAETINGTYYPAGYSARVLVTAGDLNNVYGGNDISGNIYGGNAVGIHSSIKGDVYGGGNGSYAYTDQVKLKNDPTYGDYFYDVNKSLNLAENTAFTGMQSVNVLNSFRPNAEAVSIRVIGEANKKTVIGGAIYCGGNSATLRNDDPNKNASAELKIGSYVIADKVFLGNNGEEIVKDALLTQYKSKVSIPVYDENGDPVYDENGDQTTEDVAFSQMDLADETTKVNGETQFDVYMDGVAMMIKPQVVFDDIGAYEPYSTYFGSFFCGGNVGSMKINGAMEVSFNDKVVIFDKVVGGSNEANVYEKTGTVNGTSTKLNAQYLGGLLGSTDANGNKLTLNFGGLKIQPKRWKMKTVKDDDDNDIEVYDLDAQGNRQLEWNTVDGRTYDPLTKKYTPMASVDPTVEGETAAPYDANTDPHRRFHGGNIYGGCYSNGHVNGNVVINLNASLVDRKGENAIFDQVEEVEGEAKLYDENYNITRRYTGVLLGEQGMDPLGRALNVFGGGYGGDSEIWGSTTINLNGGYTFQIFGGGEQGAIGKADSHAPDPDDPTKHNLTYNYDKKYSTCINLRDQNFYPGTYRGDTDNSDQIVDHDDMAEAEFIYGGSFEGLIAGNTCINLGNGRIFNSFAGSCNADILGHTETYVGRNSNNDNDLGFPWIRDHIYGGNDLGGRILGEEVPEAKADCDFTSRVSAEALPLVYKYSATSNPKPAALKASAYTEYIQGRVEYIFGGCYGSYDYTDPHYKNYTYTRTATKDEDTGVVTYTYSDDGSTAENVGLPKPGFTKPRLGNAFVNFRPVANNKSSNTVKKIFGAGQGYEGEIGKDSMQMRSYVLVDVPASMTNFQNTEVFGAGSYGGLGFNVSKATAKTNLDSVTAVIDLVRGTVANVYGGSWNQGMTRRTMVNVPEGSTVKVNNIFGGAYGSDPLIPCDVFEAIVNYNSEDATVTKNIYGGNNHADRTLYGYVNVSVPVWQNKAGGYLASVYGAGYGKDSWSQYTEVNLTSRAQAYEVYGGGKEGQVLNLETINKWKEADPTLDLTIGTDYVDYGLDIPADDVNAYLVKTNGLGTKTNTNVYINKGVQIGIVTHPTVSTTKIYGGYAYGGGEGSTATVSGTTYIGIHGGSVHKDVYAGGWGGAVMALYDNCTFTATANAYLEGGTVRNIYGGGYEGDVGKHTGIVADPDNGIVADPYSTVGDILGNTNVVIGIRRDQTEEKLLKALKRTVGSDATTADYGYYCGLPTVQRNAYGGGEGGSVYGTANLTINDGYIGYVFENDEDKTYTDYSDHYIEKIHDETQDDGIGLNRLKDYGNAFGAGYDDKSRVDFSHITMWGGIVRGSMYGGGEIATVGRGRTHNLTGLDRGLEAIDKSGGTHIEMYNGHVKRNVFGGGKGYNILGYGGTHELYTDGYVFGQTQVYIHGGEIGTEDGVTVKDDGTGGYGNVFGGGDVGYVFGKGYFDENSHKEGTGSPNHYYYFVSEDLYKCTKAYGEGEGAHAAGDEIDKATYNALTDEEKKNWEQVRNLTEDCKVVVSPYLQVKDVNGFSINGNSYSQYDYVKTEDLNLLPRKNQGTTDSEITALYDAGWGKLFTGDKDTDGNVKADDPVERGVLIHNAVFAGGNVSSNSDKTYANATTVFGNSTATLYDVYHRDFITVGTEHIGGLYGGGNLSMVDGYRELNITNYGTDYYGQNDQITLEEYRKLSNRERAYFKLQYVCMTEYTYNGKTYSVGDKISEEDYNNSYVVDADHKNTTYWEQYGFCSIYAGRLLNTIQRSDLCGVFGSRMVLQGARDRVAEVGSTSDYTINRVGELSLNKQQTKRKSGATLISGDSYDSGTDATHGNYFGIYSVVNYLGNLTSDVHFDDPHMVVSTDSHGNDISVEDVGYTYYSWKTSHLDKKDRNNGTSLNQVALASGVFLELTTENSTPSKKIYGYVTGIIELDLINIKKDIEGGGYVYARNEHGVRTEISHENTLLSEYNKKDGDEALTNKIYQYSSTSILNHQTSGNFIHKRKRIVDDCYPNNGVYDDGYVKSPAHYWYIKGEVYIYDQVVSAYAGSASAYSKEVKIPLTITAASNGRLQLLNVQPNRYAYFADESKSEDKKITSDGVKVDNERTVLHLNDVVTWWDWHQLADNEQRLFVKETYVNVDTCYVGGYAEENMYPTGTYVLENDKTIHDNVESATAYKQFLLSHPAIYDKKGNEVTDVTTLFHPSNNISHESGYVLTFDMDSPKDWDDWYSPIAGESYYSVSANGTVTTNRKRRSAFESGSADYESGIKKEDYREGPTFKLNAANGLYGQTDYEQGDLLSKEVYDDYTTTVSTMATEPTGQATVVPAYVAVDDYEINGTTVVAGNPISETEYNSLATDADKAHFDEALLCINTIQLGDEEFILRGDVIAKGQLDAIAAKLKTFNNGMQNTDKLTDDEALSYVSDCLTDAYICTSAGKYGGQYFTGGTNYSALKAWCALPGERDKFSFNYDAFDVLADNSYPGEGHADVYDGVGVVENTTQSLYSASKPVEYVATYTGDLSGSNTFTYHDVDGTSHTMSDDADRSISREDYEKILNEQRYYTRINVAAGGQTIYIVQQNFIDGGTPYAKGQDLSEKDYHALSAVNKLDETKVKAVQFTNDSPNAIVVYYCYEAYGNVTVGTTKTATEFANLNNDQKYFTIQGREPTQTSTLYVARESNAKDVTSEKVITVVYQYTYYEPDDEGEGVSLSNELHVVNIHLQLESGAPEVGPLNTPPTVLPGRKVGLKAPYVNPGLYEVINNGWEIYTDEQDAIHHRNGTPFYNNSTKLYWYQHQKRWVAFYSKTYLGKTYSNPVLMSVANYHDIDEVMQDKANHLYVDHPDVIRNSKIYIDNRDCESDPTKSELDLLKDFFDLSVLSGSPAEGSALEGHSLLDSHVTGGADLEFILNSDVSPKAYSVTGGSVDGWTPIGDGSHCFEGNLHGDGHTISGLDHSLFGHLCGSVFNLGATGSFTSAGIADTGDGYVENCWVKSSAVSGFAADTKAVFGNPTRGTGIQLVNCYYPETNAYSETSNDRGNATKMTEREFYNGTVAYNLNGFYLNKRYYDGKGQSTGTPYQYYKTDATGTLVEHSGHYPTLTTDIAQYGNIGYVESRYADGDFRYAGGTIPDAMEKRQKVVEVQTAQGVTTQAEFYPVWPDDYLFFGQMLSYGYDETYPHEDTPSCIFKQNGSLVLTRQSNRVYRAPAYYRTKDMGVAHFNPQAYLAAYSAPKTVSDTNLSPAYPNMTAIDFAGHQDNNYVLGHSGSLFFPPLLDDDGLVGISNRGETPNLLVYAPAEADNENTFNVLSDYFEEPSYDDYDEPGDGETSTYYDDGKSYGRVAVANTSAIHGHIVQNDLTTTTDHLLVDKQDFNCPIAYTMGSDYRMWYQRRPDNFASLDQGWEGISLPFSAVTVATQDKGELTHFYEGSTTGHEYWLRRFKGGAVADDDDKVFMANFGPLAAGSNEKDYANTFLYDYYYSKDDFKDKNEDDYQKQYYSSSYLAAIYPQSSYPYNAVGTPYLIGFPGSTYYEFDLSGTWTPANRLNSETIASPGRQTVTFVSDKEASVGVSDSEQDGVQANGYAFMPNYLNTTFVAGTTGTYTLNDDGSSYDLIPAASAVTVAAFRPYFTAVAGSGSRTTRSILFASEDDIKPGQHDDSNEPGTLSIGAKRKKIVVTSALSEATTVRITSASGITVDTFTIQPGETVETRIFSTGVYIVRTDDGRHLKKLAVR